MTRENWIDVVLVSVLAAVCAGILAEPLLPLRVDTDKLVQAVVTAVFSLVAAFAGATFAFKYNRRHEAEKRMATQVEACNRALINLMLQLQLLDNYNVQMMAPVKDHPLRTFTLQPGLPINGDHLRIDAASLAFLVETSARDVITGLAIEDQKFHSILDSINHRSKIHIDEAQVIAERTGLYLHPSITQEDLIDGLGGRLLQTLERATNEIYATVGPCIASHLHQGDVAAARLKTVFAGRAIVQFVRIPVVAPVEASEESAEASKVSVAGG